VSSGAKEVVRIQGWGRIVSKSRDSHTSEIKRVGFRRTEKRIAQGWRWQGTEEVGTHESGRREFDRDQCMGAATLNLRPWN